MVSKSQIKLITQLQQKKYRNTHKLFIAEGIKVIHELLRSRFALQKLFTTDTALFAVDPALMQLITDKELKKISRLSTPNTAVALFEIPPDETPDLNGLTLALDNVRDPGNLGTMIRLCHWFGVKYVVCSRETVDCYNPKVVQASMGSLARVRIIYTDLAGFLSEAGFPVFAADTKGCNVYDFTWPEEAVLVMGNEANGISKPILKMAQEKLAIPNFSALQDAESLNVAMATAVLLSEFRRGE